jgi:hypothetical protein
VEPGTAWRRGDAVPIWSDDYLPTSLPSECDDSTRVSDGGALGPDSGIAFLSVLWARRSLNPAKKAIAA